MITFESLPQIYAWAKKEIGFEDFFIENDHWMGGIKKYEYNFVSIYYVCLNTKSTHVLFNYKPITFFHSDLAKVVAEIERILSKTEPNTERLRINIL